MKQRTLLLLFILPTIIAAQHRYFDPVFPEVKVTTNVTYGVNATVLYLAPPPNGAGEAIPQQLKMDVYEPQNDTANARPLVILLHSGQFLPPSVNGGCNGTVLDGEIVELAQRLAHRGFVVAVADYRLAWNPVASTQKERIFTYVNAVHRGVQDSRTCVRFFKKDYAETNHFRTDPDKIILWGCETGAHLALASATLDDLNDWDRPKFSYPNAGLMVQEAVNGNLDGTSVGVVPLGYPYFPIGDTLCYPNHQNYSSDFALAVNLGGFLLDTTWLQANDIPILSFAAPSGQSFTQDPCGVGLFGLLSPLNLPVVEVFGSCAVQARQAQLHNNALWENAAFGDALSAHALSISGGIEGFYPFEGTYEYAPWAFATSISPYGVPSAICDTGLVSASAYLDTVLAYFAPRACAVLGLSANCNVAVAANEPFRVDNSLKIIPNPAVGETMVVAVEPILSVALYDLQGRVVWQKADLNESELLIPRGNLPAGIYWVKTRFARGASVVKLIWE